MRKIYEKQMRNDFDYMDMGILDKDEVLMNMLKKVMKMRQRGLIDNLEYRIKRQWIEDKMMGDVLDW